MAEDPQRLTFESDPGARRATWIAAGILVAVVLWMASGALTSEEAAPAPEVQPAAPVAVSTRLSTAENVPLFFTAEGQALPDRDTPIRAEASGRVAEVLLSKGADAEAGQLIARLDSAALEANLRTAEEELERAQREFDNATALLDQGVATADRVTSARSALAAAEAQVTSARDALESASITAPFDGRIETLTLDEGEFVSAGSEVGRIVDMQPLRVTLQVPQQSLNAILPATTAQVSFITGEVREGTVSFVGTSAASETRTFPAEVEVANPDRDIPAGISARIVIPTGEERAHYIQASTVALDEAGVLGVKTVEDGIVAFYPVEVARAEVDGIWVTGLPETAEIIVIGQGFVEAGEPVTATRIDTE